MQHPQDSDEISLRDRDPAEPHVAFWLAHCHGFRVFDSFGPMGVVAEVRFGRDLAVPDFLIIESGLFRRRTSMIATSEIESIFPRQGRIVLWRPGADERRLDLR